MNRRNDAGAGAVGRSFAADAERVSAMLDRRMSDEDFAALSLPEQIAEQGAELDALQTAIEALFRMARGDYRR